MESGRGGTKTGRDGMCDITRTGRRMEGGRGGLKTGRDGLCSITRTGEGMESGRRGGKTGRDGMCSITRTGCSSNNILTQILSIFGFLGTLENLKKSTMSSLCLDTILHILSWVNSREVFRNCSISCRFLNDALDNDENQWCKHNCQHILEKDFDGIPAEPVKGIRCLTVNWITLRKIDLEKIFPDVEFLTVRGKDINWYDVVGYIYVMPHVEIGERYKTGKKWYVKHYKDGEKDGKWEYWRENGEILKVQHYKDGRNVGTWEFWGENENVKTCFTFDYENGYRNEKSASWYENEGNWEVEYRYPVNLRLRGPYELQSSGFGIHMCVRGMTFII